MAVGTSCNRCCSCSREDGHGPVVAGDVVVHPVAVLAAFLARGVAGAGDGALGVAAHDLEEARHYGEAGAEYDGGVFCEAEMNVNWRFFFILSGERTSIEKSAR